MYKTVRTSQEVYIHPSSVLFRWVSNAIYFFILCLLRVDLLHRQYTAPDSVSDSFFAQTTSHAELIRSGLSTTRSSQPTGNTCAMSRPSNRRGWEKSRHISTGRMDLILCCIESFDSVSKRVRGNLWSSLNSQDILTGCMEGSILNRQIVSSRGPIQYFAISQQLQFQATVLQGRFWSADSTPK